MDWKKLLFMVMLLGTTLFAMVGCGKAEESAPTMEQPAPSSEKVEKHAPPEGVAPDERPPAPMMDLATAAAKLGVTEQQLREALGDPSQGPPDLAAAAEQLGISVEELQEALVLPEGGPPPGGPGPAGQGQ